MQTLIHSSLTERPDIIEADRILRSCVHCGFCTATCPTYQILSDELDSPRGRIYLIKDMLETNSATEAATVHLDRCLTCRACETTCPSGVEYGHLLDIGRAFIDEKAAVENKPVVREKQQLRRVIRKLLPYPWINQITFTLARMVRWLLPGKLKLMIPRRRRYRLTNKSISEAGKLAPNRLLLLQGCVQRGATPGVVEALETVFSAQGDMTFRDKNEGCCGALEFHLDDQSAGKERAKRLIDRLYDRLATDEISHIVSSASGCGVMVKDYNHLLSADEDYAEKAKLIASRTFDATELIDATRLPLASKRRVAVHESCTLQHGQKLKDKLPELMLALGFEVTETGESHLCCGSAGTYSIMQPDIAEALRARKLGNLQRPDPEIIVTANVGCQMFLGAAADKPVVHYGELIAQALSESD